MFEQVFEHGVMTGTSTAEQAGRVTALDRARMLLAQVQAGKAQDAPVADDPDSDSPARLASVASFDPDSRHDLDPDPATLEAPTPPTARLASITGFDTRVTETRMQQALDTAGVDRELPTLPAVSELLSGAGLRGGSAYSVRGSTALVMALMAGPSAEGAWCGVVGLPSFGAEAARGLGVDLERLVLVPDPGHDWLNVVAALVDALTVVVVRPPGEVTPGEASRLAARLRTRGALLIAYGSWPGSEARLEVESNTWTGLGDGEGLLTARQATVVVTGRRAAVRRRHQLWLPGPDGTIRSAEIVRDEAPRWQEEAVG